MSQERVSVKYPLPVKWIKNGEKAARKIRDKLRICLKIVPRRKGAKQFIMDR